MTSTVIYSLLGKAPANWVMIKKTVNYFYKDTKFFT